MVRELNDLCKSKSALFLIEQTIAILIFAVCALVCVRIFVGSHIMANDSGNINQALRIAESAAESFKASGGDAGRAAQILTGSIAAADCGNESNSEITVYYDNEWQVCAKESAAYRVSFKYPDMSDASAYLVLSNLAVETMTGEEIIALTVAAGRAAG